jgi:hypothetical protein
MRVSIAFNSVRNAPSHECPIRHRRGGFRVLKRKDGPLCRAVVSNSFQINTWLFTIFPLSTSRFRGRPQWHGNLSLNATPHELRLDVRIPVGVLGENNISPPIAASEKLGLPVDPGFRRPDGPAKKRVF